MGLPWSGHRRSSASPVRSRLAVAGQARTTSKRRPSGESALVDSVSYRLIFEKNPLPMWVFDLETLRFLDVNDAAIEKYGYTRAEFLEMTIEDVPPPEDLPRLRETLAALKPTDQLVGMWRHRKKDGTTLDVEIVSTEISLLGRPARLVLVNDATSHLRAERLRSTEVAVARLLIDPKSFAEATPGLMAAIGSSEEWSVGELWSYDASAGLLRKTASWHAPGLPGVEAFDSAGATLTYPPGVGLVGRVWSGGAPAWIRDVQEEKAFDRAATAAALELREAFAFPIRMRSGVAGVMVFFGRMIREPDERLAEMMADVGSRIGHLLDRDQAEASRRLVEEAFQKAFHASPVPMAISHLADGRFIEANGALLRMFGYDRREVIGKTSMELGMWQDPEQRRVLVDRLREFGSVRDAEVSVRTKAGEVRNILLCVESLPLRDRPTIITSLVDVTDVLAAREAQARLAEIVEASEDAIYRKTLEGQITSWNAGAERTYGYAAAEAIGLPISKLVPEDRRAELDRIMDRLGHGEKIEPFETVRLRKDGRKIVVSLTISPIRDASGRLVGASTIARDVTERKRAQQLMRRSEARFRQLFEVAADAILLIDRQGTILDINPAGGALLGAKNPAALRGINLGEVIPSRELERARKYLRDLLHDRPVTEPFETYVELDDGERRFVHVRSRVIREEGMDPYVQVIARDVTPEKEFQRRLLESERRASMGQVAAFVAHEINTPLTNIALLTASLTRNAKDPMALDKLAKIDSQRRLTASILSDLLSITRSADVRKIHTDLRGVVEAAIEQAQGARKPDVALVKELPKEALIGAVDPLRLQQALVNFLKNAFQATARGSVRVRLEARDEGVEIAVTDTGIGMDAEVRARLFQPFYTTKPRGEGTGLGLLFAKQVVEAHGGSIDVKTELGRGSTFTIRLPRETTEKASPKAP